ncbi:sigma-54 dependent transcriptional regulator [Marinobacter sp. 2_MG-2023]|uniref:sigma-54-dependent transcriptional regulator n=1 Tax=Marinobacter sp. 2_MG-2023 TaxID=3062679 RepID=UPI0026E49143|nr:sigma-54 dependent transcriptional regulator [Marinobacter sp. 2_MG-2023]MDO6441342.1 sigma-54 dependent transcriptional regulator [Marinobacter sp. 2_MG-2023]
MMEKRPLVWLSAANSNNCVRKQLEANWNLIDFNLDEPVPLFTQVADGARVGVLEFPSLSRDNMPWPESWLEMLDLNYWVAIASQQPVSGTRAARLIVRYCSDFHTLPVDYQRLNTVLGHLWGMATILEPAGSLVNDDYKNLALVGDSPSIQHVRNLLRRFSATREPVLISGESSTGKEAAARFLHSHSARAAGPLVIINCAALPTTLTQSELFGYEKGAFTSALNSHQGRLEQANGGSVVFSGINELQLEQQSAILRFLQESQVERVGGSAQIPVDCRVIATTSEPLVDLIELGRFRSDVYFRLGSLEVKLPALKDRREDIPVLARLLLEARCQGAEPKKLSKGASQSLLNHSWPGNLQELQNRLRQGWLLCDRPVIEASDLGLSQPTPGSDPASNLSLKEFRAQADRQALRCSLKLANNNMSEAARLLNISRVSLYRLMDKYDPRPHDRNTRQRPQRKGGIK